MASKKIEWKWATAWLGIGLLLAGCAVSQVTPGAPLRPAETDAVVVLSVTHSGQRGYDLLLQLDGPGTALAPWIRLAAFGQSRDWQGAAGHRPTPADNPDGRLLVLRLRSGTYFIDRWMGTTREGGHFGDGFDISSEALGVRFTAQPGQITYAGNLHIALPERINYLANLSDARFLFEIGDQRERDLALLRARFPDAGPDGVQEQLAQSPKAGVPLRYYVYNHRAGNGLRD